MMLTLRSSISFGMLIAMLITACAMTTLTSVWKDPSYQGQPRKIRVIGVARKPINKRIFEDEFVRQLKARGTDAVASYTVMPDEKQGDHAVIAAKMKEQSADAALISRRASKKTVHTSVPGNDKLIWSAASETELRGSDRNQIISYIGVMVNAMADRTLPG